MKFFEQPRKQEKPLDPEFFGLENELSKIKKEIVEKTFEKEENIDLIEDGAMIGMNDFMHNGIITKELAYKIGALKKLFPEKNNSWLAEKATILYS